MEGYKLMFSLCIFAATLSIGYSITRSGVLRCIHCDSISDPSCDNEGLNTTTLNNSTQECSHADSNVCMKIVAQSTRVGWSGKNGMREIATTKVSRFCAKIDDPSDRCKFQEGASGYIHWCYCTANECNGGTSLVASILIVLSCFFTKYIL